MEISRVRHIVNTDAKADCEDNDTSYVISPDEGGDPGGFYGQPIKRKRSVYAPSNESTGESERAFIPDGELDGEETSPIDSGNSNDKGDMWMEGSVWGSYYRWQSPRRCFGRNEKKKRKKAGIHA